MKTEFLKELGVTEEQIKSIMAENGKDINAEKEKATTASTEAESLKAQIAEAQKTIAGLKKSNGDNEELQTKVKEYEDTLKKQETEYKEQLKTLTLNSAIEKALVDSKAKHSDLLATKIDREKLILGADGTVSGLTDQLKVLKDTYKDLFEEKLGGNPPANPDGSKAVGGNSYEALMANADKMTSEEVAAQFMALK